MADDQEEEKRDAHRNYKWQYEGEIHFGIPEADEEVIVLCYRYIEEGKNSDRDEIG